MRYRRNKNYKEYLTDYLDGILVEKSTELKGKWHEIFGNSNPIYLEVGIGRGQFLRKMAVQNPNFNYLGIEKLEALLLGSCQKVEAASIPNIKLLFLNANDILEYFDEGEIEGIYLNFSDPWPKEKNKNKRLTHRNMLARYQRILKKDGILEFKTDNKDLFTFSIGEMDDFGMKRLALSYDLHSDYGTDRIITTEYEENFIKLGKIINFSKYSFQRT